MKINIFYFIILTIIFSFASFLLCVNLVSAESNAMVAQQMKYLEEFCYSKNYSCIGANPYNPNYCVEPNPTPGCNDTEAQNYNMREYCCSKGWTNYQNIKNYTWVIVTSAVVILILIGIIFYLKYKRRN